MNRRHVIIPLLVLAAGCSGTPTRPAGAITTSTLNAPPVIGVLTVQGTRSKEPPNFADVAERVPVSVEVTDAESNVNDFRYTWSATLGTISGTGRNVIWTAPATVNAPTAVTLNVEVVETYTAQGKSRENRVTGSVTLSLHDSVKEVSDLSRQFLVDFSNSDLPTDTVMRHFQPGCYGTDNETYDVNRNRQDYRIMSWTVDAPVTTVSFGSVCPIPTRNTVQGDACSRVHTDWRSMAVRDLDGMARGQLAEAHGTDYISAFYYRDQKRWRLCDSQYILDPSTPPRTQLLRSLVP